MTITLFSNFFNHHQKPLADELYAKLGNNFTFVATSAMPEVFKDSGYNPFKDTPYVLPAYKSEEDHKKALQLATDSDVVVHGAAPDSYLKNRLEKDKLTFRYSERIFKKSPLQKFNPRAFFHQYKKHTRFKNKNLHMLCSSAYTANDLNWINAYPGKMYKWGYFTKTPKLDIDQVLAEKNSVFTILYVARLIDWKHPEMAIMLANSLKKKGHQFKMNIVGSGNMLERLTSMSKELNLENCVHFLGNIENEKVLQMMRNSHSFFFSSDRNEGWGAVANEAMANGCALVASHKIGAIPYLVKPFNNGMVFQSENLDHATQLMESLMNDKKLWGDLVKNAYDDINHSWSPKNAADNFLRLCDNLMNSKDDLILEGPCSKAFPTNNQWYKKETK
ncbi:glycosyltransferase [Flagellimonas crocea]|uniref:glycosyltransferase n=1 Tax=Flagellimonas crocea TaxID=3067311 RepID=UPI00296E74DA|nr:glycosyltransferase [Muricauda sp. DH64]